MLIARVQEGTGAAEAGLRGIGYDRYGRAVLGDVIVEIEGTPVTNQNALYRVLDNFRIGNQVRLKVQSPGEKAREVTVTLSASS